MMIIIIMVCTWRNKRFLFERDPGIGKDMRLLIT